VDAMPLHCPTAVHAPALKTDDQDFLLLGIPTSAASSINHAAKSACNAQIVFSSSGLQQPSSSRPGCVMNSFGFIKAIKHINAGTEIFINYGNNYFALQEPSCQGCMLRASAVKDHRSLSISKGWGGGQFHRCTHRGGQPCWLGWHETCFALTYPDCPMISNRIRCRLHSISFQPHVVDSASEDDSEDDHSEHKSDDECSRESDSESDENLDDAFNQEDQEDSNNQTQDQSNSPCQHDDKRSDISTSSPACGDHQTIITVPRDDVFAGFVDESVQDEFNSRP
jgi:hypothetical protein